MITSYALVKQRDWFFVLAQTEYGDLFKITLDYVKDAVNDVKVKYFDTIPVAVDLAFLMTGFLFVAVESGNQYDISIFFRVTNFLSSLYQFAAIGDDDVNESFKIEGDSNLYFKPRPLKNLLAIDEVQCALPINDMIVANLFKEETSQIYVACGRGPRSTLRVLRHGIAVNERAVR